MEGAVRSGYLAAEAILASLGRPERIRGAGFAAELADEAALGFRL